MTLLVGLSIGRTHAQFPSFPDSNAQWLTSAYDQQGLIWQVGHHMRSFDHDTLLNGIWYSSLWSGWEGQNGPFAGGIREDADQRVYYFHPNTNSEYLLYDFDPVVGETMEVWFGFPSLSSAYTLLMHITSIDALVNSNGTPYKVIGVINDVALNSGQGSNDAWIEGVGGTAGLFTTEGSDLFANYLDCMSHNDTIWPAGVPGLCSPMSIAENASNGIVLFPNPNNGRFTITFTELRTAARSYGVYDALGKLLVQQSLPPDPSTSEIDLSRFGAGSYLIKVSSPKAVWHAKVLLE